MSRKTVNLSLSSWAQVDSTYPSSKAPMGTDYGYSKRVSQDDIRSYVYVKFNGLSSSLKNNRLYSASAVVALSSNTWTPTDSGYGNYYYVRSFLVPAAASYNVNTLYWSNRPGKLGLYELISTSAGGYGVYFKLDKIFSLFTDASTEAMQSELAKNFLQYNAAFMYESIIPSEKTLIVDIHKKLEDDSTSAYLTIEYDDSVLVNSKITPNGCPTSGYFNPRNARNFAWTFEKDDTYFCFGGFTQQSATLYWKASGESTWHSIAASGSTQNVTVPANTFPVASTIQWYLQGTDNNGHQSTSATYTISTAAPTLSANLLTPVDSVEDGSQPITFSWELQDALNTSGVLLQYKQTGGSWTDLLNSPSGGAVQSFTAQAGLFIAGAVSWRLYVYNQDSVQGSAIESSFVCVAAPAAPLALSATPVPYTTISWQSEEQQAYRIKIDGVTVITGFGTSKSYSVDEPLADGQHTITVAVQGIYGLWSSESSATISIRNTPDGTVAAIGAFGIDAVLSWESTGAGNDYYIYRDDKKIGHTTAQAFTDSVVLGSHAYYIIQKLSDGNYNRSDTVVGTMSTERARIALFRQGGWLDIGLTENSDSAQTFSYSRTVSARHISGAVYPFLELSPYADLSASYECSFTDMTDAKAFEAMRGQVVILKSRRDNVVVGVLSSLQKNVHKFYTSYSFAVQQIHWEDYVDENA